jgi:hypothetical protein
MRIVGWNRGFNSRHEVAPNARKSTFDITINLSKAIEVSLRLVLGYESNHHMDNE